MSGLRIRTFLPTVIPSTRRHSASVIFAHGFGATANDWEELGQLPGLAHVKFILPQAPMRAISLNSMQPMPAWYDIVTRVPAARTRDGDEDEEGMAESVDDLNQLIQAEIEAGIDPKRIVIGGFSQGACLAILLGLCRSGERRLGGVVVLSGCLPLPWKVLSMLSPWAREMPLFVAHGSADNVIAPSDAEKCVISLRGAGVQNIEYRIYQGESELRFQVAGPKEADQVFAVVGMAHGACIEELQDLTRWMQAILPSQDSPSSEGQSPNEDPATPSPGSAKL